MKHRTGQTVSLAILLGGITADELIATLIDAASTVSTQKVDISRD